jgi:DHA1 family bicyclomycin/chloramphenicol resistance-like MFS transporter
MAQVTLVFALAPALAPVLGAWLHDHFAWRSVFWFLCLFGVLLIGMTAMIRETLPVAQRQSVRPQVVVRIYVRTLQHSQFPLMVLSLGFAFAGIFLYIAGAPTVIYDFLGLGTDDFGIQFIPMVAGLMLGAFASGRLTHHFSPGRIVAMGFGILAVAVVLNLVQVLLLEASILFTVGPLVIYAFGMAMIMPALTILALDCFPHHRGVDAGFLTDGDQCVRCRYRGACPVHAAAIFCHRAGAVPVARAGAVVCGLAQACADSAMINSWLYNIDLGLPAQPARLDPHRMR